MRLIYMPNSGRPIREPEKKPAGIPPALLAGGTGATAVAGFTAYKAWETIMTYKWIILLGILLILLLIFFAWKATRSKEDEPEEE